MNNETSQGDYDQFAARDYEQVSAYLIAIAESSDDAIIGTSLMARSPPGTSPPRLFGYSAEVAVGPRIAIAPSDGRRLSAS